MFATLEVRVQELLANKIVFGEFSVILSGNYVNIYAN